MQNVQHSAPADGTPVVYVTVEKRNGHSTAGLTEWSAALEAQLLDSNIHAYWYYATEPYLDRIKSSIAMTQELITNTEIELDELSQREQQLNDLYLEISHGQLPS